MVRKIVWTRKAIEERKSILDYWIQRNQSKSYSIKLNNLFIEKVNAITLQPFAGRQTDEENIRVKLIRNYLIFYEIEEADIIILTIWDGRRDSKDLNVR